MTLWEQLLYDDWDVIEGECIMCGINLITNSIEICSDCYDKDRELEEGKQLKGVNNERPYQRRINTDHNYGYICSSLSCIR